MKPQFLEVTPGSEEHFFKRMGVVTASNAHDLLPSKRGGGFKEARRTYMNTLLGEVCTGQHEEINARPLEWGKSNEIAARGAYQLVTGFKVTEGGFVTNLEGRVGCSPDLIVTGQNRGGEIKCPWATRNHIDFLLEGTIKEEWVTQIQYSLWVSGFDIWDFASFDPRMKSKIIDIKMLERDPKMMALFDEIVPQFIHEMDEQLERIGIGFGSQWQ